MIPVAAMAANLIDFTLPKPVITELAILFEDFVEGPENLIHLSTSKDFALEDVYPYINKTDLSFYVRDERTFYEFINGTYQGTVFSQQRSDCWQPLSECFACNSPLGCVNEVGVMYSVSLSNSATNEQSVALLAAVTLSMAGMITHTYSVTTSMSCSIGPDEHGQIYVCPTVFDNARSETFLGYFEHATKRIIRLHSVVNLRKFKVLIKEDPLMKCVLQVSCKRGVVELNIL